MCDILCISSAQAYRGSESIPLLAMFGERNCHGWGLGYFDDEDGPRLVRSSSAAYREESVDEQLRHLAEAKGSRRLVAHVRYATKGKVCEHNCHPYVLPFLGEEWIFAHNGTCREIADYEATGASLTEATNDSARIFEFLRDRIVESSAGSGPPELFSCVSHAALALLDRYSEGGFNLVLAGRSALFVLVHWRPFWLLQREKSAADALLMTTIEDGLTDEEPWVPIGDAQRDRADLLLIVDHHVVLWQELERGM